MCVHKIYKRIYDCTLDQTDQSINKPYYVRYVKHVTLHVITTKITFIRNL